MGSLPKRQKNGLRKTLHFLFWFIEGIPPPYYKEKEANLFRV